MGTGEIYSSVLLYLEDGVDELRLGGLSNASRDDRDLGTSAQGAGQGGQGVHRLPHHDLPRGGVHILLLLQHVYTVLHLGLEVQVSVQTLDQSCWSMVPSIHSLYHSDLLSYQNLGLISTEIISIF